MVIALLLFINIRVVGNLNFIVKVRVCILTPGAVLTEEQSVMEPAKSIMGQDIYLDPFFNHSPK
jgi:hypothetical protein